MSPWLLMKYEIINVIRGRWLICYALLFGVLAEALLWFAPTPTKAAASLLNVILLIIPLISILFTSIYWYNSASFTTLLLTQPVHRIRLYLSRWLAVSSSLALGFLIGVLPPLGWNGAIDTPSGILLLSGAVLTFIFVGLGLFTSVAIIDRMKGIGIAFAVWFYFSVVHDGVVFLILSSFYDYPIEVPSMILTGINPIDLARMSLLLTFDYTALMGYTGTILQKALSGPLGYSLISIMGILWVGTPIVLGARKFNKRDL